MWKSEAGKTTTSKLREHIKKKLKTVKNECGLSVDVDVSMHEYM